MTAAQDTLLPRVPGSQQIPNWAPKRIEVDLPDTILRRGETIHLREFGWEQLLRQLDLPARINPKYAKVTLENGVLNITAKRAPMTLASPMVEEIKSAKHSAA